MKNKPLDTIIFKKSHTSHIMSLTQFGYKVDESNIDFEDLDKDLTMIPQLPEPYNTNIVPFKLYKRLDNFVYLPRYYGIDKFGQPNNTLEGKITRFTFTGELRDKQKEIVSVAYNKLQAIGGGILSLCCGSGKTVMSLKLAELLKQKTIVIVHKTFLQDQWYSRIQQFTDARIGIIRQNKVDTKNKDIVVAMLQSLSMIDYDNSIFSDFGLCIIDECHHIGSRVYSQALFKLGCKYMLGLSATPHRADGLTKVINMFVGDIIYRLGSKKQHNVVVDYITYKSSHKLYVEKMMTVNGSKIPSCTKMISNLIDTRDRNIFIYDIINKLRTINERKILVLSERVAHLECLKNVVDKKIKQEEEAGIIDKGECNTYYYMGKCTQQQRSDAELNADILFATYSMAHEGLDIDRLNTVILATPKANIIQAIGRIMRKDGYCPPLIIDIVDFLSVFPGQGKKRLGIYNTNNYNIREHYCVDSTMITKREFIKAHHKLSDEDFDEHYDDIPFQQFLITE